MWFSFWRSRERFSLDEFRFLTDQLMKVQVVNEVNKDFVIEALRSIAELITYGDQHDVAYFEFFMEKQVMGEFVRILRISRTVIVSLQLLQTMSIVIQNLKNEHSIYYMFSNEHINHLITYSFDFRNEELLSYYISFLRAISGKLNKNTISLLVKTHNEEVVSFPLYVEAIRFAFHEESMIRTAVRALTLNVYHVGDEAVNKFVASDPHTSYFSNLVKFFREQCINLDKLVNASKCIGSDTSGSILSSVDEIEDNLYYFSDVISAGIPDIGRLITDLILKVLIFPSILPSLRMEVVKDSDTGIGTATSLYLLCCILRIVKIKDLANIVAAVLLCDIETFVPRSEAKLNGFMVNHDMSHENQDSENSGLRSDSDSQSLRVLIPNISNSLNNHPEDDSSQSDHRSTYPALREALLSYITTGDDFQVSGSLSMLATLLQTKELEESMLDALGILPQRKQQKKLLLAALVGEGSAEEQLFSSENMVKDGIGSEIDCYFQKLKEKYGLLCVCKEVTVTPRRQRFEQGQDEVFIYQKKYAKEILKKFNMEDCKEMNTPMNQKEKLSKNDGAEKVEETYFRGLVGCLMYLTATRPDILYVVSTLSRFMHCASEVHLKAAKRVVRYIKGIINYGVKFQQKIDLKLLGYSDSDWAGSTDDMRSTSGYCFSPGSGMFSWCSKKQDIVAQSTAEAEFVAATAEVNQALWLRKIFGDLHMNQTKGTEVFVDNQSAIAISHNPEENKTL